jgi:hypothetical protein
MSSSLLTSNEEQPERSHGVLPPPPSHPDDGPSALSLPPLAAPPTSLQVQVRRAEGPVPLKAWLMMVALFIVGTVVTFLFES